VIIIKKHENVSTNTLIETVKNIKLTGISMVNLILFKSELK